MIDYDVRKMVADTVCDSAQKEMTDTIVFMMDYARSVASLVTSDEKFCEIMKYVVSEVDKIAHDSHYFMDNVEFIDKEFVKKE